MDNTDHPVGRALAAVSVAAAASIAVALGLRRYRQWVHREDPTKFEGRVRELVATATLLDGEGGREVDLVLLGSSTVEFWESSELDLHPFQSRNLGMSGSKVGDQQAHVDQLGSLYTAANILVYIGSNDINGKPFETKLAPDLAGRVLAYLRSLNSLAPHSRLHYVSILQSPVRGRFNSEIRMANSLIAASIETMPNVTFIDTDSVLSRAMSTHSESLFRQDRLHLSLTGYEVFSSVIRQNLIADRDAKFSGNES